MIRASTGDVRVLLGRDITQQAKHADLFIHDYGNGQYGFIFRNGTMGHTYPKNGYADLILRLLCKNLHNIELNNELVLDFPDASSLGHVMRETIERIRNEADTSYTIVLSIDDIAGRQNAETWKR